MDRRQLQLTSYVYDSEEEDDLLRLGEKFEFDVHESYEELPEVINHPSHPDHPLYLCRHVPLIKYENDRCAACSRVLKTWSYRCEEDDSNCKFYLDIECSSLIPSIKHEDHNHLLTLIQSGEPQKACYNCRCRFGSFYARCMQCDVNYHVQCGQETLPSIIYGFHNHPLILNDTFDEEKLCDGLQICDGCCKEVTGHTVYGCEECGYTCHVRCGISEIKHDTRERLDGFLHKHVFFLLDDNQVKVDVSCLLCRNYVHANQNTSTYGCVQCSLYFHKSCIDKLPIEIPHGFHDHPLTLSWCDVYYCDACLKKCSGFTCRCFECNFDIELECISKEPCIESEKHEHLLTFFDKLFRKQECNAKCGLYSPDAHFLRCVRCDFNVHLLCSPLPQGMKHKCHWHSLTLNDYLIEDDFGEYYCDSCECLRDPKECVYRCAEGCPYVAQFDCVLDEVLRLLNEEQGKVGLRCVNRHAVNEYAYKVINKGLFLRDIYQASPEEDRELVGVKTTTLHEFRKMNEIMNKDSNTKRRKTPKDFYTFGEKINYQKNRRNTPMLLNTSRDQIATKHEDGHGNANISYLWLKENLISSVKVEKACKRWWKTPSSIVDVVIESKVVKVGNYIITENFETLFSQNIQPKYHDIGDKCTLSEGWKTIVLIVFCDVIHHMLQTKISNINEELFLLWWFRLKFVQHAGFTIDFVFKHLNKIAKACFDVDKDLYMFQTLSGYHKEIEVILGDMEVLKTRLEMLKMKQDEYINSTFNQGSRMARQRLRVNLDFTLETAAKGLL